MASYDVDALKRATSAFGDFFVVVVKDSPDFTGFHEFNVTVLLD